ncbi:Fatty acid amide hydrolase, partial [Striga hermonthica]
PRMAGFLVRVVAWLLESPIFGGILLYFLKKNNLIHQLVSFAKIQEPPLFVPSHPYEEIEEKDVKGPELHYMSPAERVQQVVFCLESPENTTKTPQLSSFRHQTIMDYAKAYASHETTPTLVAQRLIARVHESSSQKLPMSFFINFCEEDILRQANESSLRYQR